MVFWATINIFNGYEGVSFPQQGGVSFKHRFPLMFSASIYSIGFRTFSTVNRCCNAGSGLDVVAVD
jgi:hypothetical protein